MDDLNAARIEDVQQFFRTYYAPNNATLTLVGDFDPAQARQLIQQYFARDPRPARRRPRWSATSPFRDLPRRDTIRDANATLPAFMATYGAVPVGHPDSYRWSCWRTIMGGGASSRFNQRLVKQERAAVVRRALRGPAPRAGAAVRLPARQPGRGRRPAGGAAGRGDRPLLAEGVTEAELQRAKNQTRAGFIRSLQTAMGKAEALQRYTLYFGDPGRHPHGAWTRYMAVTARRRAARGAAVPAPREPRRRHHPSRPRPVRRPPR